MASFGEPPPGRSPSDEPLPVDDRTSDRLVGVAALVGLLAAITAGSTIWLLLTDPATVAGALDESDLAPFVWELASALLALLARLLDYL